MSGALAGAGLRPAHHGYAHQDLCTAILLALSVVHDEGGVSVDRKIVPDDRFDDIELTRQGRRWRLQFKASLDPGKRITRETFATEESDLRIDRLVATYLKSPADEYRLCVTWIEPDPGDDLARLIEPASGTSLLEGLHPRLYRLKVDVLWPDGGKPVWSCLAAAPPAGEPSITRVDVANFCARFVIELGVPAATTSLHSPGPPERALVEILGDRVGIGRYPNQHRSPLDVAAVLVRAAQLARAGHAEVTRDEVIGALQIRTDFGRVAQAFPVNTAVVVDLRETEDLLVASALGGNHQLVIGSPGSGKSWLLTRVAERLARDGALVARHYCHLEPGDPDKAVRVTTDVLFGNLRAELVDASPALAAAGQSRYSAGLSELQHTLDAIDANGDKAVIIVDGLDHVPRVRQSSPHIAEADSDIASQLLALRFPPGVSVIVGSQPAPQMDALRSSWSKRLCERHVPPWTRQEIVTLSKNLGLQDSLTTAGRSDLGDSGGEMWDLLWQRSEGSPLYATYLVKSIIALLASAPSADVLEVLRLAPEIKGDISRYYRYLYDFAQPQAHGIADIIGVLDFAVTEAELTEIVPVPFNSYVRTAISVLTPILVNNVGTGGIRIFHESFRRFMVADLEARGAPIANVLDPVIAWMLRKGFFADARSFRFLLSALQRAGRDADALNLVTPSFVSSSVEQAHPSAAVEMNLTQAAHMAAGRQDWPKLATCVELRRAAHTAYDRGDILHDPLFSQAFVSVFGANALAGRLLFEGRPTQPREAGLVACSVVDGSGGVAPWREYLALPASNHQYIERDEDPDRPLGRRESLWLLVTRGRLRVDPARELGLVLQFLRRRGRALRPRLIRELGKLLVELGGVDLLRKVLRRESSGPARSSRLGDRVSVHLILALAAAHRVAGRTVDEIAAAEQAARLAKGLITAALCEHHGGRIETALREGITPSAHKIGLAADGGRPDPRDLRKWIAAIRLRAADASVIEAERKRVEGEGWYRCFLRFVIALAVAESSRTNGGTSSTRPAFAELLVDAHPFTGEPRPCDLYSIRNVLYDVFDWSLDLVVGPDDWVDAVTTLRQVNEKTSSSLFRDEGGPLSTAMLGELLLSRLHVPDARVLIVEAMAEVVDRSEKIGTHYDAHALHAMRLTLALIARGDSERARTAWRNAAVFLAAYGSHKDITLFDVIESVPALARASVASALEALEEIESLSYTAIAHTDGKETNNSPSAWFRTFTKVDPARALAVLATKVVRDHAMHGWLQDRAIRDALEVLSDVPNACLADDLAATVQLCRSEYDTKNWCRLRAALVRRAAPAPIQEALLRRLVADCAGDWGSGADEASPIITELAEQLSASIPKMPARAHNSQPASAAPGRPGADQPGATHPVFPARAKAQDLVPALRAAFDRMGSGGNSAWDEAMSTLSYVLPELIDRGEITEARKVVGFIARESRAWLSARPHPLAKLAGSLEACGHVAFAAETFALAYAWTRGGGGWFAMGDSESAGLLQRAMQLDRNVALDVLAHEVAYMVRSGADSGISRHLVERIAGWGDAATATATWKAMLDVVKHRLPLLKETSWFAKLGPEETSGWSVDEAIVALLLSLLGHPLLSRRVIALSGLVRAIVWHPAVIAKPMRWWLDRCQDISPLILGLAALEVAEVSPFNTSVAVEPALTKIAGLAPWGPRRLATRLLSRAGKLVIGSLASPPGPILVSSLTGERRSALLSADMTGLVQELEAFWPDLGDWIATRIDHLLTTDEENRELASQRFRLASGDEGQVVPRADILGWHHELFLIAVNAELAHLPKRLIDAGEDPASEDDVLPLVVPDLRLHLAMEASRCPRPAGGLPDEAVEGTFALAVLGDDDPHFAGWTRIALFERRFVGDPERPWDRPTHSLTYVVGAVASSTDVAASSDPVRPGESRAWFEIWSGVAVPDLGQLQGPVAGLERVHDWLGDRIVLVPPPRLLRAAALRPAALGSPLVMLDAADKVAVVHRCWRVLARHHVDVESYAIEGCDLIVRDDILPVLQSLCRAPLVERRTITTVPVRKPVAR